MGYPGQKLKNSQDYVVMTHDDLHKSDPKLAQRAIDLYFSYNCNNKTHFSGLTLTGECKYASINGFRVHDHIL